MAKGGFKVLINGKVERCSSFAVDFDEEKFWNNVDKKTPSIGFDRKIFAVMTVTEEDSPSIQIK